MNSRGSGMRRRVARSAIRPRDPWSAAGALAGPAGRLVLECVAGASHIWRPGHANLPGLAPTVHQPVRGLYLYKNV